MDRPMETVELTVVELIPPRGAMGRNDDNFHEGLYWRGDREPIIGYKEAALDLPREGVLVEDGWPIGPPC